MYICGRACTVQSVPPTCEDAAVSSGVTAAFIGAYTAASVRLARGTPPCAAAAYCGGNVRAAVTFSLYASVNVGVALTYFSPSWPYMSKPGLMCPCGLAEVQ